jgi:hypothetical protein
VITIAAMMISKRSVHKEGQTIDKEATDDKDGDDDDTKSSKEDKGSTYNLKTMTIQSDQVVTT